MKYAYQGKEIYPQVEMYHDVIPYLGGISDREFYTDPQACIEAWRKANAAMSEFFCGYFQTKAPTAPPFSYGHLVCLGAPYRIPEHGEPNVKPFAEDIDEAIEILKAKRGQDFSDNDLFRHYVMMNTEIEKAFPGTKVPLATGLGYEGIITSAVLMRGQDFLCDLYDEPEKVHEFLNLLNESIIEYKKFLNAFHGRPILDTYGSWLADDFASLVPPTMWQEFVTPYWRQFFENVTVPNGKRTVHCENTIPAQLRYLKEVGLGHYQPSVADALTIENIRENTDVPFDWLLYAFHIVNMTDAEIEAWVDSTVQAGIRKVRTQFGRYAWSIGKMDKLMTFYKAFDKYRVE